MKFHWQTKSKYKNTRTVVDGIRFASQKEAKRYKDLQLLQAAREVQFFLRQVPIDLPGKVRYFIDFIVFWKDGRISFEDVKGMKTPVYKIKKKQVESLYPIEITEI